MLFKLHNIYFEVSYTPIIGKSSIVVINLIAQPGKNPRLNQCRIDVRVLSKNINIAIYNS